MKQENFYDFQFGKIILAALRRKNWSGARLESGKSIGRLSVSSREEVAAAWTKVLSER